MKQSTLFSQEIIFHKKYKTKTWLMKHTESKHEQNCSKTRLKTKLEVEIIFKLMAVQNGISKHEHYSTIIRITVKNYTFIDSTELLTKEIEKQGKTLAGDGHVTHRNLIT